MFAISTRDEKTVFACVPVRK